MQMIRSSNVVMLSLLCLAASCTADEPTSDAHAMVLSRAPADGVIRSVTVSPGEIREGMRLMHVTVRLIPGPPEEITVTEWVPLVLVGRLEVGASVRLIKDPARNRLTIGL